MKRALFSVALLFALAAPVQGAPAVSCHCFQDRSFDPGDPGRVEPYLLATTRSSFLAAVYGHGRKEIVRLRMGGTAGDDLWVACHLERRTGIGTAALLADRQRAGSWRAVLAARGIDAARAGDLFGKVFSGGGSDQALAAAAADEALTGAAGAAPVEMGELRGKGAGTGEIILALLVSRRAGRPAAAVFADVRAGRASWGGLLASLGIAPEEMQEAVKTLLK